MSLADRFQENGYVFPISCLSDTEVEFYRLQVENFVELLGGNPAPLMMTQMHESFRWAADLCRLPSIVNVLNEIIGGNFSVWATSLFLKQPGDNRFVGLHQDDHYWNLEPSVAYTVWIALSHSNPSSGCMQFIPCSHKKQSMEHRSTTDTNNMLSRHQYIDYQVDDDACVNVKLEPGEASIHHSRLLHRSAPNLADYARIGFVVRYITSDVCQAGHLTRVLPVQGSIGKGQVAISSPEHDVSKEAVEVHLKKAEDFLKTLGTSLM